MLDRRVKPGDDDGVLSGDFSQIAHFAEQKSLIPATPNRPYVSRALLIKGVVLSDV
jgi:hypothetical protein